MKNEVSETSEHERLLDEIVTAYLKAVEAGEHPDPQEWLQRHPDLAGELSAFFAGQRQVAALAGNGTLGLADTTGSGVLGKVRYIGDYELLEEIARGGMGVVFKARQTSLKRLVALKMILAGEYASGQELARFRTEGEAVACLQHPHIVQIYEVGAHEGHPYLSLEYCAGGSLARRLDGTPLPARQGAQMVETLAWAIHVAHQAGVVHRDLKPANILFTADDTLKITDFGLAKKLDDSAGQTASGAIVGTPSYMAPEQAVGKGKAVGPAADVYALGAILYELLTGRPPFRAAVPLETLLQVANDDPAPPRQLQSRTPRDLETICLKCLQKEPARRYATALALAEDLRRFLAGEPIMARPAGVSGRVAKWVRRRPLVAGLLAAMFLVTVAGAAALAWSYGETAQALEEARTASQQADIDRKQALADRAQAESDRQTALVEKKHADDEKKLADIASKRAQENQSRAEWQLYASQIAAAQRAWENYDATLAYHYLDSCRKDCRGWEHAYLYTLFNKNQQTFVRHEGVVWCVAYNPDGTRIASGDGAGVLTVWDAAAGRVILNLRGHRHLVTCVAWSPDGKRIVSGSWDRTLKVWDAVTGQELHTLTGHTGAITAVAFSPDGQNIVSASAAIPANSNDNTLRLWDAGTGKHVRTFTGHALHVTSVGYSPDGTKIVSGSWDKTLKIWDPLTGREIRTIKGHTGLVASVAFNFDGTKIASGAEDRTLRVWDAATGQHLLTLTGHGNLVTSVSFSRDGKKLLSASEDATLKLWDATTGKELKSFIGHKGKVLSVAFNPDNTRIVSGGEDQTVKVWNVSGSQDTLTLHGHTEVVNGVAWSHDGSMVVSGGQDRTVKVWRLPAHPETGAGREGPSFKQTLNFKRHSDTVTSVAISPDSKSIISGDFDGTVKRWDAATGQEILSFGAHKFKVWTLAFRPDGASFVSGGLDGTIKLWDAATGRQLWAMDGVGAAVSAVAMSPDGEKFVAALWNQTLKVCSTATGKELLTMKGHTQITCVAWSQDGKTIVSGGYDRTLNVWDAATGQELRTLQGHTEKVYSVAISPDGSRIVSGSFDNTLKLWDARTGQETLTLKGNAGNPYREFRATPNIFMSVAFSPDGKKIVSGNTDGTVKVWDASSAMP